MEGTYIGYAHCSGKDTARVTLYFSDNAYHSECATAFYPTSGRGTFDQEPQTIQFKEDGLQQHMDPKNGMVLNGRYNYQVNADGTIRIWREQNDQLDEYILMYAGERSMATITP